MKLRTELKCLNGAMDICVARFTFDEDLLATLKIINCCTGRDGLVPALLIFGAMHRLGTSQDPLHRYIAQRAVTVAKMTKLISIYFVKNQVTDSKKKRNGPEITELRGTTKGSYVMVYRERGTTGIGKWTELLVLMDVSDSSSAVFGHSVAQTFRLYHTKSYCEPFPI